MTQRHLMHRSFALCLAAVVIGACSSAPGAVTTASPDAGQSAISIADLRSRLYAYADDSMRGRQAGTPDNIRSTAWIAEQARRIGLQPAGDGGTFFQNVPLVRRELVQPSTLAVGGQTLVPWTDFAPIDIQSATRSTEGAVVLFAGRLSDTTSMARASAGAGKIVVVRAVPGMSIFGAYAFVARKYPQAVAVGFANQDNIVSQAASFFKNSPPSLKDASEPDKGPLPALLVLSNRASALLVGGDPERMTPGTTGKTVTGTVSYSEVPAPARNVVAIIPGTDPALRGQYVALGAHSDHIGIQSPGFDHDSLRTFNAKLHALGALDPMTDFDPAKRATIRVNMDSLRRLGPARRDSISNGADDDGSGSVGLLEIAEAWLKASGADRPRRSVLFVWHTAEELGLYGSEYFTDHPTVPRDSIVAQINIDMIGRGSASDVNGGGPRYLQLIGPKRLSSDYQTLITQVNAARATPFALDYQFDAEGHPEQIYCRSDHWNYARYGIPVAFFSTGSHLDYHQVTDEPQYIDYDHYRSVLQFVYDVARTVANRNNRLVVDKPKPDPKGECRQ
jgi:hypothetical protein